MSQELADVHAESSGPSIRDHIESAVAVHTRTTPDVDSAVAGAVEKRDRDNRTRERQAAPGRHAIEGETSDRRRADIRNAVQQVTHQTSQEASAPREEKTTSGEVTLAPGAPQTWDNTAKAHWDALPQEARLAIQRDYAGFAKINGEMESVLAPARATYRQHGLNDAQAVGALMNWEGRFRNPQTRIQAFNDLARQYGVDLHQVVGGAPQQQIQSDPHEVAAITPRLGKFAQGRPHFEQVRATMGLILERFPERYARQDGGADLDRLYGDACKAEGLNGRPALRQEPPPRSRVPPPPARPGTTVAQSLQAAMRGRR